MSSKTFWTSDLHFGHTNVIKYSNRPFTDVEEMNRALINNWNAKVPADAEVYLLGDVAFCKSDETLTILNQLNGSIHLIKGNHDKNSNIGGKCRSRFASIQDYAERKFERKFLDGTVNSQLVVMSHFPFLSWNKMHYGSWMLHGHCHGNMKYPFDAKIHDVGVDNNHYAPLSFDDLVGIMEKKGQETLDHHG